MNILFELVRAIGKVSKLVYFHLFDDGNEELLSFVNYLF